MHHYKRLLAGCLVILATATLCPADVIKLADPTGIVLPTNYVTWTIDLTPPDVAWIGSDATGSHIFSQPGGTSGAKIVGQPNGSSAQLSSASRVIAFRSVVNGGSNNGVFTTAVGGGVVLTIRGSDFDSADASPVINSSGTVAFKDIDSATPSLFVAPSGGQVLTIHGDPFSQISRPSINNAGDVAFVATPLGSASPNAYVKPSGGAVLITVTGNNFKLTSGQPKIVDNKKTLFVEAFDNGTGQNGIFYSPFDSVTNSYSLIPAVLEGAVTNTEFSVNQQGDLLVLDYRGIQARHGDYTAAAQDVIAIGDPLDGSTVTSLAISDSAMLDNGNVAFYATLANGSSGIYYTALPEPASLIFAPALWMLLRRPRRISSRSSS